MRTENLFPLLERTRRGLNLILTAVQIIRFMTFAGMAGGLFILIIRLAGWPVANFTFWIILVLSGGLAGLIRGWSQRLDLQAAARWLDEHFQNQEAFSAALTCLERNYSGSLDAFVMERAEALMETHGIIRWPLHYLKKQALIAFGILCLAGVTAVWRIPAINHNLSQIQLNGPMADKASNKSQQIFNRIALQTPQELAEQLFPRDAKLAAEAEKALQSGDIERLAEIMQQAKPDLDTKLSQNISPAERKRSELEEEQRSQMMQTLQRAMSGSGRNNQDDAKAQREALEKMFGRRDTKSIRLENFWLDKEAGTSEVPLENDSKKKTVVRNNKNRNKTGAHQYIPCDGSMSPGDELGNQTGNWGRIIPRSGSQPAAIIRRNNHSVLEYVLPGKNAAVPLAGILPDARRTAETALVRNGVPLEYSDFVRSYFFELSREITGNLPESGGEK